MINHKVVRNTVLVGKKMKQVLGFIFVLLCLHFSSADVAVRKPQAWPKLEFEDVVNQGLKFGGDKQNKAIETVVINENADNIINEVSNEILMSGWDPMALPDHNMIFEFRPILITYTGRLSLTVGRIQGLSTFSRSGDAFATYIIPPGTTQVEIPLSYRHMIVGYNFLMNVRGDTVEGVLYAWVDDVVGTYTANLDGTTVTNTNLEINIGSLQIDLFGSGLSSTYRSLLRDLTTDFIRSTVLEYNLSIVGGLLDRAVARDFGAK